LIDDLYKKEWVVYCKPPFESPKQVLKYLGQYTHRIAISNHRIVSLENEKVTFWWRDYRDGNQKKLMTLDVFEFIRRFLLHVLPVHFVKIRHYGLLSSRSRKTKLKRCQELLEVPKNKRENKTTDLSWEELLLKITGIDPRICPVCGKGKMITIETINSKNHSPPGRLFLVA
jgi:hypothetical protein